MILGSLRPRPFHPHPSPLPEGEGVMQRSPTLDSHSSFANSLFLILNSHLVQLRENHLSRRTFGDVPTHVIRDDLSGLVQDERRRSRHTVSVQVEYAVVARNARIVVSENVEARPVPRYGICPHKLSHVLRVEYVVRAYRDERHVALLELRVRLCQLTELAATYPSEEASVEHDDDGLVVFE